MDDVWSPAELLYCLKHASCKEDGSFAIILEKLSVFVVINAFTVEIVLIINEIHLHPCCRNGSNLDHERSVHIVDDDIHSRKADHLVKLVLSFVDAAVSWHE